MLLLTSNFQNEDKIVFNDRQTTIGNNNDPNNIVQDWVKGAPPKSQE